MRNEHLIASVVALLVLTVGVVAVGPALAQTEEQEPNEDAEDANPVGIGENVTGEITTGDTDWYVTENVTRGQSITVNFTNPAEEGAGDHFFRFYDRNVSQVESGFVAGNESVTLGDTVEGSGPYYIQVEEYEATGPYSFTVNVTGEGNPETPASETDGPTTDGPITGETTEPATEEPTTGAATEEPATAEGATEEPTTEESTDEDQSTAGETTGTGTNETGGENGGSGAFGPGFGPVIAVVALLAIALYVARRRE